MNLSAFDFNLLRVLDALLRDGSTTAAGIRIGLSQPAVSAALARLRTLLDDPLFVRHGQRLEPTEYAKSLEVPLRGILDQIFTLLSGPEQFEPFRAKRAFKISGSDFFAEMLMPQLAAVLSQKAPGIRVHLVDLVPDDYIGTLERSKVDLAFVPNAALPEWVDHQPVFRSRFVIIARSNHPRLARAGLHPGDVIPLDLFCDLGHVVFSPEGNSKAMGDAALASVGRERRVVMTLPVFSGVGRAVSESDLVALLPRQLALAMAPRLGLELYLAPMDITPALMRMIWNRRTTGDPAHRWFRSLVAELLRPLNEGEASLPE